jgi:hypothetical protein
VPISVSHNEGVTTFDNADNWTIRDNLVLDVTKDVEGQPAKALGSYGPGDWSSVKKDPKLDKQLQFEEALELIRDVDGGGFGNQDSDWQERADALLQANS